MKKHIPNILTLLNLLCGSIAVIFVSNDTLYLASILVLFGIFFDFFDGFAARKLNVQSPLGLQLDSLADMVTSGLVPGLILYKLLGLSISSGGISEFLPFIGLAITLASGYRLAKFNIDEEQQNYFKGLPTPANALLIISLPLILEFQNNDLINAFILNKWFLIVLVVMSTYLLNSKIRIFTLKFKDFHFQPNALRYLFLIISMLLLFTLKFVAIPLIIVFYITLSLISYMK